jgi:hypothetical protein
MFKNYRKDVNMITAATTFRARMNKPEGRVRIQEEGRPEGDEKIQPILDPSIFQPLKRHCRHMQRTEHVQQMS